MLDYSSDLLELIRLTSTDLPRSVEGRLRTALESEAPGSAARLALETILQNVEIARQNSIPICQDTGTPNFYVRGPASLDLGAFASQIRGAIELATEKKYLRPNAVDARTGKNSGNNLGDDTFPLIHFQPEGSNEITVDLLLKGGGCENVSAQYSLPDASIKAERDLDGVRRAALDAVFCAQGRGCAPGYLGIAVGGDRATSYAAAKACLLQDLDERNSNVDLAALEDKITAEANQLGIGPMGFGGKTTILGSRVTSVYRLPASYFVSVSYMCWAYRRRRMILKPGAVIYL